MSKGLNVVIKLSRVVSQWFQDLLTGREDASVRAAKYDRLKETTQGLKDALATHGRTIEDLTSTIESLEKRNSILQGEYKVLQDELEQRRSDYGQALLLRLFSHAKSALVQLPTLRHAVRNGAALEVPDVLEIVSPLESAFAEMGFTRIGEPGEVVTLDLAKHTLVTAKGDSDLQAARVRVRYVGYALNGHVVSKAEVSILEQENNAAAH